MTKPVIKISFWTAFILMLFLVISCSKDDPMPDPNPNPDPNPDPDPDTTMVEDPTTLDDGPVDFSVLGDTYGAIADPQFEDQWAHYNTHDPAYWVDEKFTYSYSTDVAFGAQLEPGIQIRRSINLVEWEFVGRAFPGIPSQGRNFIQQNGTNPFDGIWAPYMIKVGEEYRLYYSLSSEIGRLSTIGLLISSSPKGPFVERGLAVTSLPDNSRQTNAIDPTVIIDKSGDHWMYYGSAWDGIYKLQLDPVTGLALRNGDKGVRVAQRGFTGNTVNGNIEGPEIIYNEEFGMYYLFIAYDWLETKYNVRVGRSENATGPFYDIFGNDMNMERDDLAMILAPYRFEGHSGWQGVSHCGVFEKEGDFYIGHQGRPGIQKFYMVMHTRQIFWTEDGWPLVSCQRYATEEETEVINGEIAGEWEVIDFEYTVVPGYANEQTSPDFQDSKTVSMHQDGSITGEREGSWSYTQPWMTIDWSDGESQTLRVERGRDWENEIAETILFTGLNAEALPVWGKKI